MPGDAMSSVLICDACAGDGFEVCGTPSLRAKVRCSDCGQDLGSWPDLLDRIEERIRRRAPWPRRANVAALETGLQ